MEEHTSSYEDLEHSGLKFKSIVRRLVFLPLLVMGAFALVAILVSIFVFLGIARDVRQRSLSSVTLAQKQISYQMNQMDQTIWKFWEDNESNRFLLTMDEHSDQTKYVISQGKVLSWMDEAVGAQPLFQGMMIYYGNIDHYLLKGISNFSVHEYLKQSVREGLCEYGYWQIIVVDGEYYFLKMYKYDDVIFAVWVSESEVSTAYQIHDSTFGGDVYYFDKNYRNTLSDQGIRDYLENTGIEEKNFTYKNMRYQNFITSEKNRMINMGIVLDRHVLIDAMPIGLKIILILFVVTFICVPLIIRWLQRKVARPIRAINDAMTMIGEGHMDYRIAMTRDDKVYDEIDRLIDHFNKMMDDLNELEYNLYISKIKEQQTELKYISQQIRPHFILNALNIIYTYDVSEFDLVKKMVLYLTDYFRYIVNLRVDLIELEKEMYHVQNYLNIQKERYMDSFDFIIEWEVEVADVMIPPLILQTFVENCIKYAIKGKEKLYIYVLASLEDDKVKLLIKDTGKGYSEEALEKLRTFLTTREHQDGLGVGIENAIERMDILYKTPVDIQFDNAASGGAVVEIYLPIVREMGEKQDV